MRQPRNPIVTMLVDGEADKVYRITGYFPVMEEFVRHLNDTCIDDSKVLHGIRRFTIMQAHDVTVDSAVPYADDNPTKWIHQQAKDFLKANPRIAFHQILTKMSRGDRKPISIMWVHGGWGLAIPEVANGTSNVIQNLARSTRLSHGQVEEYLREWVEVELGKEVADKVFAVSSFDDDDEEEEDELGEDED